MIRQAGRQLWSRWRRLRGSPDWDPARIRTTWFDSHFNYAADQILEWVASGQPPALDGPGLLEGPSRVLDFGCGGGVTTLGLALKHPHLDVLGVDVGNKHEQLPALARDELGLERLPPNLRFRRIAPGERLAGWLRADIIATWSVFEHVERAAIPGVLTDLRECLSRDGALFLQIEPLFHSPWGSHLRAFVEEPWAHLLWSEEELFAAVRAFDGSVPSAHRGHKFLELGPARFAEHQLSEYRKLNQCTAGDIERLLREAGFQLVREHRGQLAMEVPEALASVFPREDLLTNELRVLACRRDGG